MSGSRTAWTALHDAAQEGDVRRVALLVEERKEDVWTKDISGWLPIHVAARHGGPDVVRFFVLYANGHPKDGDMANAQINDGSTPLHLAARKGDVASLEVLVGEGRADPWIKDEDGLLPIHTAATFGHPEAVRFFLRYNASHPERGDMLNERDNDGDTPLSWAVKRGHVECVRLLLLAGADVTIANEAGYTRVHLGYLAWSDDMLSLLTRELTLKDKYDVDEADHLGHGSFGYVTTAIQMVTGVKFARKTTRPSSRDDRIFREIKVMEKLRHRNVVALVDHFVVQKEGRTSLTLILELCHENLSHWLRNHPFEKRRDEDVRRMLVGLSTGLSYIHEQRIIHRDLHTSNVLVKRLNGEEIVKITDFGLSVEVNTGETSHTDRVGCQLYRAPEVRVDDERRRLRYDYKVDVYAEGLLFYELLADFKFTERVQRLKWAIGSFFVPNFGSDFPEEVKLIKQMLSEKPENRPSSKEVAEKAKEWEERATAERKRLEKNLNEMHAKFEALQKKLKDRSKSLQEEMQEVTVVGMKKIAQKIEELEQNITQLSSYIDKF
ncbi:unnamed protein product [Cyprideis torosa]|uniref:Uncharacterized protein n=1 Tax=Cyprideis torosa TaxID=163714 RepID=A0A7R8WCT5_9CRUS|nr:unnamed protein product [Cyprideis torosa]CAG0893749.1 unnamed protein product [Cyprideis torosa]